MNKHIWILAAIPLAFAHCDGNGGGGDETGTEETGTDETGSEETSDETGDEDGFVGLEVGEEGGEVSVDDIDCNAYCADVGECAEDWGTTPDALVPECVQGCLDAPPIEQHLVAECLDGASTCDDVSNCLPDSDEGGDICDEYCGPVGDCAGEWGAATEDVLDSCLDGCTEASAEEQLSVAGCLDASENCDDILACIPE